jgi:hypothetical protein
LNPDWMEQLPSAEPLTALETALRHLNDPTAPSTERVHWLTEVDTKLHSHAGMLCERYVEARRLPVEDETRMWEAGHGWHDQLSRAYMLALDQIPGHTVSAVEASALLARILYHRGHAAAWRYFRYISVPDSWWLGTHKLYLLAEQKSLAAKPVTLYDGEAPASCASLYMKILLLDTLNRTNMTKRQIADIDLWLQPWSVQTKLEREYREDSQLFFVDLNEDRGGRRIRNFEPKPSCRYWQTDAMIVDIVRALEDSEAGNHSDTDLESDVLQQMHSEWSRAAYRRQRRNDERDQVAKQASVANGIYAVCQEVRSQAVGASLELEGELWRIEDESRFGFGAEVSTELNAWLKVGRLIALREELNLGMSVVGVVRSLQHRQEGKVHVGVEVLSHMALYASLQDESLSGPGSGAFPGIFISSDAERELPASVLLPAIEYLPDARLRLRVDRRVHHVRLSGLLEQKDDWVRAEVEVLD